jgi:SAM-dependent methyltransferase
VHRLQTRRAGSGASIRSSTPSGREERPRAADVIYALRSDDAERDRLRRQSLELDAPARELTNVHIVEGDARLTNLPTSSFDLVHARLRFVNIPRPQEVLSEMVRIARPGGWVASQEPDVLFLCDPPHRSWQRLTEAYVATYRQDGAHPFVGRRLRELYRQAGLVDVQVAVRADHHPAGDSRHTVLPDLIKTMRSKIIARELLSEQELDELDRVARAHLSKTSTLTVPHLLFTVWGRKPDSQPNDGNDALRGTSCRSAPAA